MHTYRDHPIGDRTEVTLYAIWETLPDITISYKTFGSGTVTLNQTDALPTSFAEETGNPETGTFVGATAAPAEGWKFDGWHDVAWLEKHIGSGKPQPVTPFPALDEKNIQECLQKYMDKLNQVEE